ncbi:MAG: hypothetical protein WCY69_08155, partial [Bacteroidales bacterium]
MKIKTPLFLKILGIFTLIGSSLRIIASISVLISKELISFWLQFPGFSFLEIYSNIFFNSLLIISSALSFLAVLFMWRQKIIGFYIYLMAQWGLILIRMIFYKPIFITFLDELPNILLTIVFSISYA